MRNKIATFCNFAKRVSDFTYYHNNPQTLRSAYPNKPEWLAKIIRHFHTSKIAAHVDFEELVKPGAADRLAVVRKAEQFAVEVISLDGHSKFIHLLHMLYGNIKEDDVFMSRNQYLVTLRFDTDPFVSFLQGLVVGGDLPMRRYHFYLHHAKQMDELYLNGKLKFADRYIKPTTATQEEQTFIEFVAEEFTVLQNRY